MRGRKILTKEQKAAIFEDWKNNPTQSQIKIAAKNDITTNTLRSIILLFEGLKEVK